MFVLLTAALSFHGAAVGKSSIKMTAKAASKSSDYSDALGVIEPTGFFDPLGLSSGIDQEVSERARARAHITNIRHSKPQAPTSPAAAHCLTLACASRPPSWPKPPARLFSQ
jgi:hypothetical protein